MTGPGLRVRKHHRAGKGNSGLRVLRYDEESDSLMWDSHKILGAAQHVLPIADVEVRVVSQEAGSLKLTLLLDLATGPGLDCKWSLRAHPRKPVCFVFSLRGCHNLARKGTPPRHEDVFCSSTHIPLPASPPLFFPPVGATAGLGVAAGG